MKRAALWAALVAATVVAGSVSAAEDLVRDGSFESVTNLPSAEFRCSNDGTWGGKLELFTEDLSWNKCAKLIAGSVHDETSGGHPIRVSSACLHIGGASGIPVEPDMYYDFAFELKGSIETVIARVYELSEKDGKATRKSAMKDQYFAPGKDWRRYSLRYHSGSDVRRVELCLLVWSMEGNGQESFAPGDFVLIDNVSFSRSERYAKLLASLRSSRDAVRVAPYPVETEPACPFLPLELAEPPSEIVFRAAVNEKKVLPLAAVQRLCQCLGAYGRLASVGQPQFQKHVVPALANLLDAADKAGLDAVGALAEDLIAKARHAQDAHFHES
mgnify:CR=1 FL=1